jgi:flagellin
MSSINTNLSAITALQALKATQTAMNKNQNQISTGLRVGEAADNASYWSIATQMKSDNGALSAVKDSIKQSKAMIDTFTGALSKVLGYMDKTRASLVNATQPGASYADIGKELDQFVEGMKSAVGSANFNGQNWLAQSAAADTNIVISYDSNAAATKKIGTLTVKTTNTNMFTDASTGAGGSLGALVTAIGASAVTDAAKAKTATDTLETAYDAVKAAAATLGATKALLESQEDFIGVLADSITAGVSAFIDADMNEASTRNQALQTQQQLGVQALSMANQNSQMILKLFQ